MKILYGAFIAIVILCAAAVAYSISPPTLDAVARPDPTRFDETTVARGEQLALIGNCADCHTAEGGEAYAGDRPIHTELGTIYGTNITPDEDTGIGRWSLEAFRRAMHSGLDREGNHLYPAFPYHHFTKVSDEDVEAIYAYLMTLDPVHNQTRANDLTFPFNIRPLLAGWKLLYLDEERYVATEANEVIGHGAYLVRGLGHCGGCHTPRNALEAEIEDEYLQGEMTEGWHAPAIAGSVPAPAAWSAEQLTAYLSGQWTQNHGIAFGPMARVAQNLARVPREDVEAMSAYLVTLIEPDTAASAEAEEITGAAVPSEPEGVGAAAYAGMCAQCHDAEPSRLADGLQLAYSTSLRIPEPRNLIRIIEHGVQPPEGRSGPFMPGFTGTLTQAQMVALVAYLRERFTGLEPWPNLDGAVADVMNDSDPTNSAEVPATE